MNARQALARISEWMLRPTALREARAVLAAGDAGAAAIRQAKLLAEVARRVADPVEPLPAGSRAAVLLALYREAVTWALVAGLPDGAGARDLAALWAEHPPEKLLAAGKDAATVEAARAALVDMPSPVPLEATDEQAKRARIVAEGLVWELDAPRRRVDRVLGQRWIRLILTSAVVVAAFLGVRKLALGPNLAANKPFRTSSSWSGCAADPPCRGLLFHTDSQTNPWVEFDLGAPKAIHRIEVTNRGDCCGERTIPLVAELSSDGVRWTEVARRETEFSTWTAKFPRQAARYVRLRVPRDTVLHLEDVAIR
jgi:hypothetical protein